MNLNLHNIWTVAAAEGRITRRLVRYWVFLAIAWFIGIMGYLYYGLLHAELSYLSATVGLIGPRYLMGAIGLYYITGYILVIVFLGFDVRARDVREQIVEVLDSRPLTNFELITGRFIGLLLSSWIPVIVLVLLIQLLGWLLPLLGSPIGRTVEPVSLVMVVLFMALPAIAFSIALVFLLTLVVRNRLLAALLSIAALAGLYWALFTIPYVYSPYVDFLGVAMAHFPSDIVPSVSDLPGWLQRIGILVISIGFLGIAAVIHPRLDGGNRTLLSVVAAALVIAGLLSLSVSSRNTLEYLANLERWHAGHAARIDEPAADIQSMKGAVRIVPGDSMDVSLRLVVRAPPDNDLDNILLTLNPGLEITYVKTSAGKVLTAQQADGLLDIKLDQTLPADQSIALDLVYHGRPDTRYGYLDSTLVLEKLNLTDAQVNLLGSEKGIFAARYVALMPGIRWLPAAGADVGRDDHRKRRQDYFNLDLEVEVPAAWMVAGSGKRTTLNTTAETITYKFSPEPDIPEVALMASKFKRFATDIDGITFEVLVSPGHDGNFAVLAEARDEIEQWVRDQLQVAADAGLAYPYAAFTLVEVPTTLRGYAGGWRLDTALAQPAMMLMRESGFPTARFDRNMDTHIINIGQNDEGQDKAKADLNRLISFFRNDISGGNLFTGAARSFFAGRTSAYGPNALALDFTLEELATLLLSGQRSYFSAQLFKNINSEAANVVASLNGRGYATSLVDALIYANAQQTGVWNSVLQAPLSAIDPYQDPQRAVDILTLKGGEMAQALYDSLGPEKVGRILANLLKERAGTSYTIDDVIQAGVKVDADLGGLFKDWFTTAHLPGFVAEDTQLYRLPDNANGDARYQMLIKLRNDEPVTGFARISWNFEPSVRSTSSKTLLMPGHSAIRFGVVLSKPPFAAAVNPYLSLNRDIFNTRIWGENVDVPTRNVEPVTGVHAIPWQPGNGGRIYADDLDDGFEIIRDESSERLRLAGNTTGTEFDHGLPVARGGIAPSEWSRQTATNSWGRYRHTVAYIRAGDGSSRAVMRAVIPHAGQWELEIHVPFLPFLPPNRRGTWNLEIVTDEGKEAVRYDATAGVFGWNLVGQYQLPAGEVRVEFSDKTDGRMVVADAISWSPVNVKK